MNDDLSAFLLGTLVGAAFAFAGGYLFCLMTTHPKGGIRVKKKGTKKGGKGC